MEEHEHSKELIEGVSVQFREILENSEQGVYIYLDDTLKACNKKFSDLLGYDSPQDWASVETSFPEAFVAEDSRENLISAYQDAMEKMVASQADITWKKKDGEKVKTKVILVPIVFNNHLFALHFISQK